MSKTKKNILIIGSIVLASAIITAIIFLIMPTKVMEFHSDDNKVTITISRYKAIGPFADPDYIIEIAKDGKSLLNKSFEHNSFKRGELKESDINIQWYDDHVTVLIKKTKGAFSEFTASY